MIPTKKSKESTKLTGRIFAIMERKMQTFDGCSCLHLITAALVEAKVDHCSQNQQVHHQHHLDQMKKKVKKTEQERNRTGKEAKKKYENVSDGKLDMRVIFYKN